MIIWFSSPFSLLYSVCCYSTKFSLILGCIEKSRKPCEVTYSLYNYSFSLRSVVAYKDDSIWLLLGLTWIPVINQRVAIWHMVWALWNFDTKSFYRNSELDFRKANALLSVLTSWYKLGALQWPCVLRSTKKTPEVKEKRE